MTRHELETTSKIPRDELMGLLNTMASVEKQRITAPIAVAVPDAAIDEPAFIHSRPCVAYRPTLNLRLHRFSVIAIAFAVTLALGLTALIVA